MILNTIVSGALDKNHRLDSSIFEAGSQLRFVDVILPLALPKVLTYFIPPELDEEVNIGQRVVVISFPCVFVIVCSIC